MLERLDDIDWERLGHAYGSAEDVPEQIRALRSPDAAIREKARWQLYGNIFHQGSRYEATAYAVPFLLELLADPATAEREELVGLLAAIAVGYDEMWLPDGLPIAEHRQQAAGGAELLAAAPHPGDDDFDEDDGDSEYLESLSEDDQDRLYAHVLVAAYDAVRAGVPLLRTLLAAEHDLDLRVMAGYTLSWFPEEAEGSLPVLAGAVTEALGAGATAADGPDHTVLAATALVAIGLLGGVPDPALLDDRRPLVRWGAATGLARAHGPGADRAVAAELLGWAGGESPSDDRVPFLDGDLAGYAGQALAQLGAGRMVETFDALLRRIPAVSGVEALHVVGEALKLAFPGGPLTGDVPFDALDERQRRLVRQLADHEQVWRIDGSYFGNFRLLVGGYGLPDKYVTLRSYAGQG
ncbi:hypothetical protein [Plantactinospora sp. KLBMP9567]|uniref:hypothetical protein n=1 Tax=Plantactinospora sp. KLBMP9567 TaxID=3085900 RepID=UPI002981B7EF|nr:hypothetical protein [Plantactinospora sp. KLBMP9567]MDW5326577.1 hypothetical protein [Plantactinospora sp. KLBMP9567]